jgi:hypothetical protein
MNVFELAGNPIASRVSTMQQRVRYAGSLARLLCRTFAEIGGAIEAVFIALRKSLHLVPRRGSKTANREAR